VRSNGIGMEVDQCPGAIQCLSPSAFMLEAHLLTATPGCDGAPVNDGIDSMQVILGPCERGETSDHRGSPSLVPIVWVADDEASCAAAMGGIKMFARTVDLLYLLLKIL
jgi:hypothetical protein